MGNIAFVFDNYADLPGTIIAAASEVASMPASNLLKDERWKKWRSGPLTADGSDIYNCNIDVTIPDSYSYLLNSNPPNCFAILNTNLVTFTLANYLNVWSDSIGGATFVINALGIAVSNGSAYKESGMPKRTINSLVSRDVMYFHGASIAGRFWRFTLRNLRNIAAPSTAFDAPPSYIEASRVIIGYCHQMATNFSAGISKTKEKRNESLKTYYGNEIVNPKTEPVVIDLQFDYMSMAEYEIIMLAFLRFGYIKPFFALPYNNIGYITTFNSTIDVLFSPMYCTFDDLTFVQNFDKTYHGRIRLKEYL